MPDAPVRRLAGRLSGQTAGGAGAGPDSASGRVRSRDSGQPSRGDRGSDLVTRRLKLIAWASGPTSPACPVHWMSGLLIVSLWTSRSSLALTTTSSTDLAHVLPGHKDGRPAERSASTRSRPCPTWKDEADPPSPRFRPPSNSPRSISEHPRPLKARVPESLEISHPKRLVGHVSSLPWHSTAPPFHDVQA